MDAYYSRQRDLPYFEGPSRQVGMGIGSLALRFGRFALPAFKKYILPTVKRVGKDIFEMAAPELLDVVTGKTKIKKAIKRVAKNTAKNNWGVPRKPALLKRKANHAVVSTCFQRYNNDGPYS